MEDRLNGGKGFSGCPFVLVGFWMCYQSPIDAFEEQNSRALMVWRCRDLFGFGWMNE